MINSHCSFSCMTVLVQNCVIDFHMLGTFAKAAPPHVQPQSIQKHNFPASDQVCSDF